MIQPTKTDKKLFELLDADLKQYNPRTIMQLLNQRKMTHWRDAFYRYNSNPNNKHLGMGCAPCFYKVHQYFRGL